MQLIWAEVVSLTKHLDIMGQEPGTEISAFPMELPASHTVPARAWIIREGFQEEEVDPS